MDLGTVLSAAQTLFTLLQGKDLREMCSLCGYKSQLDGLQRTVSTVKAVLRDAETKRELSHEAELWIHELKDAVYDADDLLDEFVTLAQRKELIKRGNKASKKVRLFFSRYNPLGVAYNMSQGVKKIRKKLDAITNNHAQFGFSIDPRPIRQRREESCSYVYEGNIIGREDDVEKIVGHLLNDSQKEVSVLTIVGIGGLGKTALAQLVFNDARVKSAFPLKLWTCVADHDQEQLDVEQILHKILASATGRNHEGCTTKDWLQSQVREQLTRDKYLLVLDDVWTENRNHWLKLEEFLLGGQRGSWVVITTRSHKTATIVGGGTIIHELQGLSQMYSWRLFKIIAFGSKHSKLDDDLVKIGQQIVEGCARVPLAIRVAGSLLYGQDKNKWLSFQGIGLSNFREGRRDIMPILNLSYHQLEPPLKSCFAYCALFPKDFVMNKELLISLWMAQGYIVPLDDGQTMEDAAEEYFSILMRRCFFQDVKQDENDEVVTCKIHDLMHDIARTVAGEEMLVTSLDTNVVDKRVRHLAHLRNEPRQYSFTKAHIRTYLCVSSCVYDCPLMSQSSLDALIDNWKRLRALDLSMSKMKSLPDSIGDLLHLRYLDLSSNSDLEVLPKSFIKLYNLQTLKLRECIKLKELPQDFHKLINLRMLYIIRCGMEYLKFLGSLPRLKVLQLGSLNNLQYMIENGSLSASTASSTPERLICFPCLENLVLWGIYNLKGWINSRVVAVGDSAQVHVDTGSNIIVTPIMLPQLKSLKIEKCPNLCSTISCPNLEVLDLESFNKGLQIISTNTSSQPPSSFLSVPKLRKVTINDALWLKSLPMEAFQCLTKLVIWSDYELKGLEEIEELFRSCSSSLVFLRIQFCGNIRSILRGGLEHLTALKSLEMEWCENLSLSEEQTKDGINMKWPSFHHSFHRLSLQGLSMLKNLPNWIQFLDALQTLEIIDCKELEALPVWMHKLTSLTELRFRDCSAGLNERCQRLTGEDWPLIQHIPSIQF